MSTIQQNTPSALGLAVNLHGHQVRIVGVLPKRTYRRDVINPDRIIVEVDIGIREDDTADSTEFDAIVQDASLTPEEHEYVLWTPSGEARLQKIAKALGADPDQVEQRFDSATWDGVVQLVIPIPSDCR